MEQVSAERLTQKEKVSFFAFLIFAIAIVVLGFKGIGNHIKSPFAKSFAAPPPTEEELKAKQIAELKSKDTDHDGLSDYDEMYVYNTSPYLADTDSDGISDRGEIARGTDPNCPEGQKCFGTGGTTASSAPTLATSPMQVPDAGQILLQSILTTNSDPKVLRDALIKSGIDQSILNTMDDATLMQYARATAHNMAAGNGVSAASSTAYQAHSAPPTVSINGVQTKVNPDELRALLRTQGMTEAQLQKIDDATLIQTLQDIVSGTHTASSTP